MSAGARAWAGLAAFVAVWDALCPAEQMLTDTARRHPAITFVAVTLVGGHLTRALPVRMDPLHAAVTLIRRDRGRTTRDNVRPAARRCRRLIPARSVAGMGSARR